ncbi:ATP-binding cassette domain-containing protein [Alloscardovia venturai]|uniref:ATP-binding cassette domain-containing protein n=1 Tax=Alloscardovia venturai TaxID=1769421 RepID=A0ABW2Y1P4_9BIFI
MIHVVQAALNGVVKGVEMKIVLRNLSFSYVSASRERKIFENVNFTFGSDRVYSIMGPSGTGKTTLFKLLSNDLEPSEGTILFDDRDSHTLKPQYVRSHIISRIYQDYLLVPYMTAGENILLSREILGTKTSLEEKENAHHLLDLVGIGNLKDTPVRLLSGGEQQRVCIARALASQVPILLADEPTGALDKENTLKIGELLRKVAHERSITVLVATHDPLLAEEVDEQCVIDNFRINSVA